MVAWAAPIALTQLFVSVITIHELGISPGCVGGRLVGSMVWTSVVVGAADVVGIGPVEPEDHSILVVDPYGVISGQIPGERVEAIAGRDPQVVEYERAVGSRRHPPLFAPVG